MVSQGDADFALAGDFSSKARNTETAVAVESMHPERVPRLRTFPVAGTSLLLACFILTAPESRPMARFTRVILFDSVKQKHVENCTLDAFLYGTYLNLYPVTFHISYTVIWTRSLSVMSGSSGVWYVPRKSTCLFCLKASRRDKNND